MTEQWLPVLGFPAYRVSSAGAVYSEKSRRPLSGYVIKGYRCVTLHRPGERKIGRVHRLVAETFHGPPSDGLECAHLDGDALNNSAANLAWVSRAENEGHKRQHGTANAGERSHYAKLTNEQAHIIRKAVNGPLTWREVSILSGIGERAIWDILRGKTYRANKLSRPFGDYRA